MSESQEFLQSHFHVKGFDSITLLSPALSQPHLSSLQLLQQRWNVLLLSLSPALLVSLGPTARVSQLPFTSSTTISLLVKGYFPFFACGADRQSVMDVKLLPFSSLPFPFSSLISVILDPFKVHFVSKNSAELPIQNISQLLPTNS